MPDIEDKKRLEKAIAEAEKMTSGEIRVCIEKSCKGDVLDRAAYCFKTLKMHQTELRNGVLVYVAKENRAFAIIGDVGIHQKVGASFWDEVKETMAQQFKQGDFNGGIEKGVLMAGEKLSSFFPIAPDDINELSNEIVTDIK